MGRVQSINRAYLLTGGNLGDRAGHLHDGAQRVSNTCGKILSESSLYQTDPWGNWDQPAFLNQALLIETALGAEQLMQEILSIEKKMGRVRDAKYGARTIDIDILFYNHLIINTAQLAIPHPQIQNRRFALVPMNEIAPGLVHPVLLKDIKTLLEECKDNLNVKKI